MWVSCAMFVLWDYIHILHHVHVCTLLSCSYKSAYHLSDKLLGFQGVRTSTRRGCKGNFPNNPIVHDVIGIIVQQLTERKHFGVKFACNLTIQAEDKHSCSYVFLRSLIFIRHINLIVLNWQQKCSFSIPFQSLHGYMYLHKLKGLSLEAELQLLAKFFDILLLACPTPRELNYHQNQIQSRWWPKFFFSLRGMPPSLRSKLSLHMISMLNDH